MLLLAVEASSFVLARNEALVGYDTKDTATSLSMGIGNVVVNFGWKFVVLVVYAGLYELTPLRVPTPGWRGWSSSSPIPPTTGFIASATRCASSGQPRRPPLQRALQPQHRAAPDVGADDLPAVSLIHHRVHHGQRAVPRPQLRGHPDHLGPPVRHVRPIARDVRTARSWRERWGYTLRGPGRAPSG